MIALVVKKIRFGIRAIRCNLIRIAHPCGATGGCLSRYTRLWLKEF